MKGVREADALAAGEYFNCSLGKDKSVQCWGYGGVVELKPRKKPVSIFALDEAAGVLYADGTSGSWLCPLPTYKGRERWGKELEPLPRIEDAVSIVTGDGYSCALTKDRRVKCVVAFGEAANAKVQAGSTLSCRRKSRLVSWLTTIAPVQGSRPMLPRLRPSAARFPWAKSKGNPCPIRQVPRAGPRA